MTNRQTLTGQARVKSNVRSYAHVYRKRGKLSKEPCADCGSGDSQMHHPDYKQPLLVIWLCRPCHLNRHTIEKTAAPSGLRIKVIAPRNERRPKTTEQRQAAMRERWAVRKTQNIFKRAA